MKIEQTEVEEGRRPGRMLAVFKAVVLLALMIATAYGTINRGLYPPDLWLPVAVAILGLLFITLFVSSFYRDVPRAGWVLFGLLAVLVGIKGLSMTWTISEIETVRELLRSSMYLATFVLVLAALSAERQVAPLVDAAVLIAAAVAGYGILQKIDPVAYPATSPDASRIGSTLEYANTTAVVIGMGIALGLVRMTTMRQPLARGLFATLLLLFGAALYFTFSRGGLLAVGVGLVALFVLSSNRLQMFTNLLLVSIPGAWLLWRVQDLEGLLLRFNVSQQQRVADGAALRTDLIIAMIAAFLLQVVYAVLVQRYELVPTVRRVLSVVTVVAVLVGVSISGFVAINDARGSEGLLEAVTGKVGQTQNANERLTSLSSNSRAKYWRVAWEEWKEHPFTGTGAGTFMYTWLENRPGSGGVKQVHNVYLEQGTETGIFAFLALAGFALGTFGYAARATWRASGDRRLFLAGLTAAVGLYLFHSAFEWHWYIPASTLFFFVLAAITVKLAARTEWSALPEGAKKS